MEFLIPKIHYFNMIVPDRLQKGDTIGIISPSENIFELREQYLKGLEKLKSLGFKIKIGKHAESSYFYSAGKPEDRLADIHDMFEDKEVKAILTTMGGETANELLDKLDYKSIKKNPKIISGISDGTTLLLPIHYKTQMITFYGPDVIFTFGQQIHPKIEKQIINAWTKGTFQVSPISGLVDDNKNPVDSYWKCIREGKVEGRLIGGYLDITCMLIASRQIPVPKDKILFLESMGRSDEIHKWLQWLKLLGVFDEINGLILGYFPDVKKSKRYHRDTGEIILELTKEKDFPILQVNELGHMIQNYVWPIGLNVKLDATNKKIEALEKCVK